MFLLNSCLGQFSAATLAWHSFSRSYGVILPSSLTMLLPPALGFSPHPPVSVYGTGTYKTIAAFLDSMAHALPYLCSVRITSSDCLRICLCDSYLACTGLSIPGLCSPTCPHSSVHMQYRNFNLLSIGYVFRPRLRPRLTQSRSALLWKPWIFGRKDSTLSRYSFRHSLFMQSTAPYGTASSRKQCSSTNLYTFLSFGVVFQPRTFSAQDLSTSELLRTL